jgi:hypothetical protein
MKLSIGKMQKLDMVYYHPIPTELYTGEYSVIFG